MRQKAPETLLLLKKPYVVSDMETNSGLTWMGLFLRPSTGKYRKNRIDSPGNLADACKNCDLPNLGPISFRNGGRPDDLIKRDSLFFLFDGFRGLVHVYTRGNRLNVIQVFFFLHTFYTRNRATMYFLDYAMIWKNSTH